MYLYPDMMFTISLILPSCITTRKNLVYVTQLSLNSCCYSLILNFFFLSYRLEFSLTFSDNLMHCLFLLTQLIFHVFELLFQYVLSILYVIANYFSLRATTLQSFTINHNNNNNNNCRVLYRMSLVLSEPFDCSLRKRDR